MNPADICMNLIMPESSVLGCIFATDNMGSSYFKFCCELHKMNIHYHAMSLILLPIKVRIWLPISDQ